MERKSTRLKTAINERRALVVPGCHDALSAQTIAAAGFEAVQISGFGLAASLLGKPDVGLVAMKDILDFTWNIVQAVDVPVMADVDTGGGNAINAAAITARLIEMGAAGMNIEDQVFPKRCGHMSGKQVIDADEMVGKIRACADARQQRDEHFVINARTDAFASFGLGEAVERCNRYLEAGADLVFIDAIGSREDIATAVRELNGPLSVNLMDGVTGVRTELIPIPELAELGVARVSIPVASVLVAHQALRDFFTALRASPSGILAGENHRLTSFEEFTGAVGLAEYQAMEKRYLPTG